ncbi:integrase [Kushneria pakistanensis]|uniref:Integrase n=1 Tax=Kushneria pakistanensis TaxID=1508770 RepID=A0ABQ3FB06_9GAMM|nr:site-specific integrase [Kushneria pakistanensis]GHC16662.1 integrase [Kushneria pakistanensis]
MGFTVSQRKDRGTWVVRSTIDGRRSQRTFQTEGEARQYALKAGAQQQENAFNGVMGRKPKRTFSEGLQRMVSEYDVRSQKQHILLVAKWMDEHAPDVVIGQELLDAARKMQKALKEKGLAQSTINNRIQVVKRVLSLAYREWDWLDLPLDGKLRKPSPKNERHVYLTEPELAELLEAVPARYEVERQVILLAMLTGMRRGELLALEPGNVYSDRIVLKPNQTKNGKPRVIPLSDEAQLLVGALPFATTGDKVRVAFEKARETIGRQDIRFHDMRHCYASLLASKGETLTSIRDLLGHSSLTVTSRYAHADPARWDSVMARLPRISNQTATKH